MTGLFQGLSANSELTTAAAAILAAILAPLIARLAQGLGGNPTDVGRRRVEAETARVELLMKMRQLTEATPGLGAHESAEMTALVSAELARLRSLVLSASTQDARFEAIRELPWWRRYFVLPMPKGVWAWMLSFFYFYFVLAVLLSPFSYTLQVSMAASYQGVELGLLARTLAIMMFVDALFVGIAALIRRSLFIMRRKYEAKRVRGFSALR